MKYKVVLFVALLASAGCHSFGPRAVGGTYPLYNEVISQSLNEQFLLNLVRLRYRDNPYFLEVGSVAVNTSLESSVSAGGSFISGGDTFSPSGSLIYTQNPTVSYTPLRGNEFLKQMLTPVPLEALLTLTQSGWSVQRVMRVCIERANELDNAANASGPTPGREPRFEAFQAMADLLRDLQQADAMELGAAPAADAAEKKGHNLVLRFKGGAKLAGKFKELCKLLGVPENSTELVLTTDFLNKPANGVAVRTRSMMAIMFFLSHNIVVPASDEEAGLVTITRSTGGERFDWSRVTGRLFAVNSGGSRPANAYLSVPYRGNWFYLRHNDLESKSTFMLLNQLFNLQSGDVKMIAPTFTIGVGN